MRLALHARAGRLLAAAALLTALVVAAPSWAAASAGSTRAHALKKRQKPTPILRSPLLWATVDACNAPSRPNTIGIRGSMPGDGRANERMFLRFRVQYLNTTTGRFAFVAAADSGFVLVGPAHVRFRQAGRNFQFQLGLQPPPYRPHYVLRGWIDFQWRKKHKVVRAAAKVTTAPHPTGAAGDPPGFAAATCTLG